MQAVAARDESLRDRLPVAPRRRPLACAGSRRRSRCRCAATRPSRARTCSTRSAARSRTPRSLSTTRSGRAARRARGRLAAPRLPGAAGSPGASAGGATPRPRCRRARVVHEVPRGSASRAGSSRSRAPRRCAALRPDFRALGALAGHAVIADGARRGRARLRLALLRAHGGRRRGPGDRAPPTARSRRTGASGSGAASSRACSSRGAAASCACARAARASTCWGARARSCAASSTPELVAEEFLDRARQLLGGVVVDGVAGAGDDARARAARDPARELFGVARRQDAVALAPDEQRRRCACGAGASRARDRRWARAAAPPPRSRASAPAELEVVLARGRRQHVARESAGRVEKVGRLLRGAARPQVQRSARARRRARRARSAPAAGRSRARRPRPRRRASRRPSPTRSAPSRPRPRAGRAWRSPSPADRRARRSRRRREGPAARARSRGGARERVEEGRPAREAAQAAEEAERLALALLPDAQRRPFTCTCRSCGPLTRAARAAARARPRGAAAATSGSPTRRRTGLRAAGTTRFAKSSVLYSVSSLLMLPNWSSSIRWPTFRFVGHLAQLLGHLVGGADDHVALLDDRLEAPAAR